MPTTQQKTRFTLSRYVVAFATAAVVTAPPVDAAPDPYKDARSTGMGMTGVAASNSLFSALHNPALLALPADGEKSGLLVFPSLGIQATMDEDLIDDIDRFQDEDRWETLEQAIDDLNAATGGNDVNLIRTRLQAVVDAANAVNSDLSALDNSAAHGSIGVLTGFGRSSRQWAWAAHFSSSADVLVIGRYNDQAEVERLVSEAEALLAINNPTPGDLNTDLADITDDPTSEGEVMGIAVSEVGITLANTFTVAGRDFQVGITPKYQEIRSFYYLADIDNFDEDDFDSARNETDKRGFNLDLGLAYRFGSEQQYTAGFRARNLISRDLTTVELVDAQNNRRRETVELKPHVSLGFAYAASDWTATADLDLTRNSASGFEDDRQYLAIGGEYDALDWLQLRGGIRYNLASGAADSSDIEPDTTFTLGLGFSPGWFHGGLSAVVAENTYGGVLEFGILL